MGGVLFSVLEYHLLYIIGYTLNVITLAGITIALGMLIDNAVVVFEQVSHICPHQERAYSRVKEFKTIVPVLEVRSLRLEFYPLFALKGFVILLPAVALTVTLLSSVIIALGYLIR